MLVKEYPVPFNIVHIVSSIDRINFGIWNAAIFGAAYLEEKYGIQSRLWVCQQEKKDLLPLKVSIKWIGPNPSGKLKDILNDEKITSDNTLIVSHGCWLMPTRIGYLLKQLNFKWIYVPHGMLEPWSMKQRRIKKMIYYWLVERKLAKTADVIRAVSEREKDNLEKRFQKPVELIENGVEIPGYPEKNSGSESFLFMARLHYKKGIVPLVKAWTSIMSDSDQQLIIAGPDEGELQKIETYLGKNITYAGAVYGAEKEALLKKSHYYLLPSFSEGFPTSVLEAMSFGLIPLISEGCNFNQVFSHHLGYRVEPDTTSLETVFRKLRDMEFDNTLSLRNHEFIRNHYSEECIGRKLFNLYSKMMNA